jgi:hypothetical protein
MNYLTNYYRNICEQLQERLNVLEQQLQEAQVRGPAQIKELGSKEADKAKAAVLARGGSEDEAMQAMSGVYKQYLSRANKREGQIQKNIEILPDLAQTGDVETTSMVGNVLADVSKALNPTPGSPALRELEASKRAREDKFANIGMGARSGKSANVADMRRFIEIGKGQFQAPWQQEPELTPDNFDGPDADNKGSSAEVVAQQQQNQFSGNIQKPFKTPSEMTASFFSQGRKPTNIRLR